MRKLLCGLIILFCSLAAKAQLSSVNRGLLKQKQDSLSEMSNKMINASLSDDRQQACADFIPALVKVLETKGSFHFQFDSLQQVSILYDQDSSFRIFSWGIAISDIRYRFYGAIQMNTDKGDLKLFPLFDNSMYTNDMDTITNNRAWIGALYYKMIETKKGKKIFYTLMGWGGYDFRSNKKMLDVLTFKEGQPVFGAPIFNFNKDSVPDGIKNRFFLIYKRDGNAGLNYNPDLKMIIYDHLTSINSQPEKLYTLVPDGTYEGFKWENGYWMHESKVFHTISEKPPLPSPLNFGKSIIGKDTLLHQ